MGAIQRQGILNTVLTYTGVVIGFANLLVIQPMFLTTEEVGLVRVLYSFSMLMSTLMPLGITNATTRFFPRYRDPGKGHSGFLGLVLLFPVVGFLLIGGLVYGLSDAIIGQYAAKSPLFTEYFHYVFPLSLVLNLVSVLNVYCFAHFRTVVPAFLQDVVTRIGMIVIVSAYFIGLIGLDLLVAAMVGVYALQLLLLIGYLLSFERPVLRFDTQVFKGGAGVEIAGYAMLFSFAAMASLGLKQLDVVMLGRSVDLSLVGVYSVVATIPAVIEGAITALEKVLSARISDSIQRDRWDEVRNMYVLSSRYLLLLGGLLFLGINLSVSDLLSLLPGPYGLGLNVVYILSAGVLFNMATGANTSVLFYSDHYRAGLAMLFGLIILAFAFNLIFIPIWGLEGAAFATVSSIFLYNLLKFSYIWRVMKMQPFDGRTVRNVALIAVCCLLFFLPMPQGSAVTAIVLRSVVIALAYGAGTLVLGLAPELVDGILNRLGMRRPRP